MNRENTAMKIRLNGFDTSDSGPAREPATRPVAAPGMTSEIDRFSSELLKLIVRYYCVDRAVPLKMLLEQFESEIIGYVLAETGGNQRETARILGVKYTTLNHKVIKLGLLPWRRNSPLWSPAPLLAGVRNGPKGMPEG